MVGSSLSVAGSSLSVSVSVSHVVPLISKTVCDKINKCLTVSDDMIRPLRSFPIDVMTSLFALKVSLIMIMKMMTQLYYSKPVV